MAGEIAARPTRLGRGRREGGERVKARRAVRAAGGATVSLALAGLVLGVGGAWGQQGSPPPAHEHTMKPPGHAHVEREGKEEHEEHGPPEGWKFTFPKGGDPARGRAVFVRFECFSCHQVKGETFPPPDPSATVGPELSAMAGSHPPEFFAESIINPDAVIDPGQGYEAPDGSSKMPSFNEDLTVQELVDLVAYLLNLKPSTAGPAPAAAPPGGHGHHGR
jgi:mono/diheme cytochrome c family protein